MRAFPENLKQLSTRTNGNLQTLVNENLAEEIDPTAPHPMLWREFASSLGVSDAALDATRVLPGIAALLDTFDEVAAQGTMAQAVAMFYSYEAQVPEIASQKISGFAAFTESPIRGRWLILRCTKKPMCGTGLLGASGSRNKRTWTRSAVLCAAERSLKALWGALDAVYPQGCASKN